MTENADHLFSATLSSRDLALIGCLRALADFSQRNISRESTEEQDWRAAAARSRASDRLKVGNAPNPIQRVRNLYSQFFEPPGLTAR